MEDLKEVFTQFQLRYLVEYINIDSDTNINGIDGYY